MRLRKQRAQRQKKEQHEQQGNEERREEMQEEQRSLEEFGEETLEDEEAREQQVSETQEEERSLEERREEAQEEEEDEGAAADGLSNDFEAGKMGSSRTPRVCEESAESASGTRPPRGRYGAMARRRTAPTSSWTPRGPSSTFLVKGRVAPLGRTERD